MNVPTVRLYLCARCRRHHVEGTSVYRRHLDRRASAVVCLSRADYFRAVGWRGPGRARG